MKKSSIVLIPLIFLIGFNTSTLFAQYAPAAGEAGSTAIHKDSSIISSWATLCEVERGFLKISDTTFTESEGDTNRATQGVDTNGIGKADGILVSLGDGGSATLQFNSPISNVAGPDFAVFENSFKNNMEAPFQYFLELAFVEVSSDGERFVRFPAYSNTPVSPQIETFGQIDPTQIHNLAGKYKLFYGTPFDLDDIADSADIDLDAITHVRVVDVVGSTSARYASYDCLGNRINDPWPTPFASGGFDLDAVGVIDGSIHVSALESKSPESAFEIYPNPSRMGDYIHLNVVDSSFGNKSGQVNLFNTSGQRVFTQAMAFENTAEFQIPNHIHPGTYVLHLSTPTHHQSQVIHILQ